MIFSKKVRRKISRQVKPLPKQRNIPESMKKGLICLLLALVGWAMVVTPAQAAATAETPSAHAKHVKHKHAKHSRHKKQKKTA